MSAISDMQVINSLDEHQTLELHALYQKEWWTRGRSLEDTKNGVDGSQICIGLVDQAGSLQAFARVLTDYTFKALIFDFIVSGNHRGKGLGQRLISLIKNHHELKGVKHFELYCLPDMFTFYGQYGFSGVEDIRVMRLERH